MVLRQNEWGIEGALVRTRVPHQMWQMATGGAFFGGALGEPALGSISRSNTIPGDVGHFFVKPKARPVVH